jgi:hypothetical protein
MTSFLPAKELVLSSSQAAGDLTGEHSSVPRVCVSHTFMNGVLKRSAQISWKSSPVKIRLENGVR